MIRKDYPGNLTDALRNTGLYIKRGDRLLLRGGVYSLDADLFCILSGVEILPYPKETPVLLFNNGGLFLNGHDVVVSGLVLDGNHTSRQDGIKITDGAYNITLKGNEIRNFAGQGVLATNGKGITHNIEISDNHIHDNGVDSFTHGIYVSVAGVIIHGNEIENNAGHGIHVYAGNPEDEILIEKNFVHDNTRFGIGIYSGRCTVYNNISRGNGGFALNCDYGIAGAEIQFNTFFGKVGCEELYRQTAINFTNNVMTGGYFGFQSSNLGEAVVTLTNNLIKGTSQDYSDPTGLTLRDNINLEFAPIMDDGLDTIIPQSGNPVIRAGVKVPDIKDDYNGKPRRSPPTVGAWEG